MRFSLTRKPSRLIYKLDNYCLFNLIALTSKFFTIIEVLGIFNGGMGSSDGKWKNGKFIAVAKKKVEMVAKLGGTKLGHA